MELTLKFKGRFPSIDEYNNRKQESSFAAHNLKRKYQTIVLCEALGKGHYHFDTPVFISCRFYEKNKKRNFDAVSSFVHKITQAALVEAKVIHDTGWGYVAGFKDEFFVDHKNPHVEIRITEAEVQP